MKGVIIFILFLAPALIVCVASQNTNKEKCLEEKEKRGIAVNGRCGGVIGGDYYTEQLSYECVDCPYLELGGVHKKSEEEKDMSDLISRKKLMEQLRDNVLVDVTPELERTIMEQPTAYDVDKVVEQINKKIEFAEKQIVKNPADKIDEIANNAAEDFIEAYKECIEIIRGGGAE